MIKQQFDERDVLFSRLRMVENSNEYIDYYQRHPEKEKLDQNIRKEARLRTKYPNGSIMSFLAPKADWEEKLFQKEILPYREITFKKHEEYLTSQVSTKITKQDTMALTKILKNKAIEYGACLVGVVKLSESDYYSYKGLTQFKSSYGEKIKLPYKYAIIIAVEMNSDYMKKAPRFEEMVATEAAYDKSVFVSASLAIYLKQLGYEALTNNYINYLAPMVPLSIKAGLGEKGKNNLLVTKKYGSRIRTAAVLTNMTLIEDQPISFGLQRFCEQCMRCVERCPTQALAPIGKSFVDDGKCMEVWLRSRTDCGICIAVCPFSKCKDVPKLNVE